MWDTVQTNEQHLSHELAVSQWWWMPATSTRGVRRRHGSGDMPRRARPS